jgi:hypothetical protein
MIIIILKFALQLTINALCFMLGYYNVNKLFIPIVLLKYLTLNLHFKSLHIEL